jgi:hypothetical protein
VGRAQVLAGAAVVVLAAVGVVLVLALRGGGDGLTRGGPLACADCNTDVSMPLDVGALGTFGAANLENHGKVPAVLERVAYLHRTRGLLLLGPLVARNPGVGLIREFPPHDLKGKLRNLRGFRVPPYHRVEDDVDVLVGVSPLREGSLSYAGLDVYYRVGKRHYVTTFDFGVRVCAPGSVPQNLCDPPPPIRELP